MPTVTLSLDRRIRTLGLAAALLVGGAAAALPGAAAADVMVILDDDVRVPPAALIGQTVSVGDERIGEVVDLIGRAGAYNDVLVRLDEEHHQMGVTVADPDAMAGKNRPIIVGGSTIAVEADSLMVVGPNRLALHEDAVSTLDEFGAAPAPDIVYFYSDRR